MYQKALVPLDGSALAECALGHVQNLVKKGAVGDVTLLNVVKMDVAWAELYGKNFDLNGLRAALFSSATISVIIGRRPTGNSSSKVKSKSP